MEACKRQKATLVIAELDRLARNMAFIANLMESGAEFVAVDMPQANTLTVHIMAVMAEHEREMISALPLGRFESRSSCGKGSTWGLPV